jgi:hypothetical protein
MDDGLLIVQDFLETPISHPPKQVLLFIEAKIFVGFSLVRLIVLFAGISG